MKYAPRIHRRDDVGGSVSETATTAAASSSNYPPNDCNSTKELITMILNVKRTQNRPTLGKFPRQSKPNGQLPKSNRTKVENESKFGRLDGRSLPYIRLQFDVLHLLFGNKFSTGFFFKFEFLFHLNRGRMSIVHSFFRLSTFVSESAYRFRILIYNFHSNLDAVHEGNRLIY